MRHGILGALLVMIALAPAIEGSELMVFSDICDHYEAIRLVLIEDSTEGVAGNAAAISSAALSLASDFSPAAAGVDAEDASAVEKPT